MELTGIEPFGGHMKMEGEAERHFVPIEDALKGNLDTAALFELYMPVDAFRGRRKTKGRSIQRKLVDWVRAPVAAHAFAACRRRIGRRIRSHAV
jgi:hypothetical protein